MATLIQVFKNPQAISITEGGFVPGEANMFRSVFLFTLIFILSIGSFASGQCISDGNDTEADATPIGYIETVSDWVCTTDVFDYYTLDIPQGASVSGDITFSSPQRSTVLRVWHADSGTRIVNDIFTNDTTHDFTVPISLNNAPGGTYYARVFYWSEAAFDHEYTLTLNLTIGGVSQCEPDVNETTSTAGEAAWGSSVSDWICADDTIDMWHFTITDPDTEGFGTISLDADPGEVTYNFYDSNGVLLETYPTTNGEYEHNLGWQGTPTPAGEYYIGVTHLAGESGEHSYTLGLAAFRQLYFHDVLEYGRLDAISFSMQIAPWPSLWGTPRNSNNSTFSGAGSEAVECSTFNLRNDLGIADDTSYHGFREIVLGPDNRAYFKDQGTHILYAWDLMDGYQWEFPLAQTMDQSFCLDSIGNIYCLGLDGVRLYKLAPSGEVIWSKHIKLSNGSQTILWPVGDVVCVTDADYEKVFMFLFSKQGHEIICREKIITADAHKFDGVGMGKDGSIYFYTRHELIKYNKDGTREWSRSYAFPSRWQFRKGKPLIGEDGRIFVYLSNNYTQYVYVYNPDGTLYKSGQHSDNADYPEATCAGADGRLYVSTNSGQLICYEDWDQEVWRIDNPGEGRIMRIAMDGNFVYLLYYVTEGDSKDYHWVTVGKNDGQILYDHFIVQPGFSGCDDRYGHIAIGENGYLVYMNQCGHINVYKPVLRPQGFELNHDFSIERFTGD